jgi:hypothetical protein
MQHAQRSTLQLLLAIAGVALGCDLRAGGSAIQRPPRGWNGSGTLVCAADMSAARAAHTATTLPDGRVLLVGGSRSEQNSAQAAELYDPASGSFARAGDMGVRRHKHDAVRLADGRVLITGGADERDNEGTYDSTEWFDPKTLQFTAGPSMNLARYKHKGTSMLLSDGTVLLAGGAPQAETLDPLREVFTLVGGDARMAGQFSAVALLSGGGALITGGYGQGTGARVSAWLYRP